ncbi:hypothetical protein KR044_010518, partial [Drosophila immigrans]
MKGSVVLLLVAAISWVLITRAESADYRLSRSVVPSFYNITIDFRKSWKKIGLQYDGEVAITLQTNQSDISEITLHGYFYMSSCLIYNKDGILHQNVSITSLKNDRETRKLTVPLLEPLTVNENYTLYFQYEGHVDVYEEGVVLTGYEVADKRYDVIVTQLDPVYAPRVFPCFDDPSLKAKFELHISRPSEYNVISNTKLVRTTDIGNDRFMDHFDVTPIMSTHLLAFVISEYQARGNLSDFAVLSAPEYYNYTEFSYNVGKNTLMAYNDLFEVPYKELGNEVLQFAVAPWFDTARPNWGLITFSEVLLVHKPGYTDGHRNKEATCRAIAHELALMWFGNSVTISWWSHLWLSVGFAAYYENFMSDELCSDYDLEELFVVNNLQKCLEDDAAITSLPLTRLETEIQSPAEIKNQSNTFVYDKGASIIRMWHDIMGQDNFNKSIKSYLKEFHLKNVEPSDLFAHLKRNWPAQPEVDLDTFFADFTEQPGYPMVIVNISDDNQRVILHQKRFLYDPEDGSDATLRYTIPITFTTNLDTKFYNNSTPYTYFHKNMSTVEISFDEPIEWIVLNLQQSNYYRVLYDKPILSKLLSPSNRFRIPQTNRAQIVDDLFIFAHAGMIDYTDVFEFLEYLNMEIQYLPWKAAYHGMERVARRLTPQQLPHFEKYLRNITYRAFNHVNIQSKSYPFGVYNQVLQLSWLCKYQNEDCNKLVKFMFEQNIEKPSPDFRETIYCGVSRTSAHAEVWRIYQNETDEDEKDLLLRAIACTRDYRTFLKLELFHLIPDPGRLIGIKLIYQQNPDLITPIFETIIENIEELS